MHKQSSYCWCKNNLKFDNELLFYNFFKAQWCVSLLTCHPIQLLHIYVFLCPGAKDLLFFTYPHLIMISVITPYEVRQVRLWQTYLDMCLPACIVGSLLSWQFWFLEGLYCKFWLVVFFLVGHLWIIHI